MFIGEYSHNLDNKGRVAVPAKFRALLKNGSVVTKGLDNCLFLYPKKQWEVEAKRIAELPMNQSNARAYARNMLAGAMEMEFDNQGRVTLPEYLRDFAQLKKEVVIAGLYDKVEIWDKSAWDSYKTIAEKNNTAIAEALT